MNNKIINKTNNMQSILHEYLNKKYLIQNLKKYLLPLNLNHTKWFITFKKVKINRTILLKLSLGY